MTTLVKNNICCSVCGNESEQTLIVSTNAFGSPDLDRRPPNMQRSTIHALVQRCPECGVCANDLSKVDVHAEDVVKRAEYKAQLKDIEFPELANSFICESMIDEHLGGLASATRALIHAAWACDDAKSTQQAMTCRRRAAAMLRKSEASGQELSKQPGASTALLVDLLRRADALDEAAEVIEKSGQHLFGDVIQQILLYQQELINAGDLDCHNINEVLRDEDDDLESASSDVWELPVTPKRWWQFWKRH